MAISAVQITVNGQQYNAAYNGGSGKWEATLTAPNTTSFNLAGQYYPVSITAVNTAGSSSTVDDTDATLGSALRLVVREKVKPTITITSPGAGAHLDTSQPPITFQLRDETGGSGVDLSTLSLTLDGTAYTSASSGMAVTAVVGGYDVTYTPPTAIEDGSHSVNIGVSDNDGNTANAAARSFNTDTIPPQLNITSPSDGAILNTADISVAGSTNSESETSVVVAISLNGDDQGSVSIDSNGAFSKALTLDEGANVIVVTATDAAGQVSISTINVTLDTTVPQFTSVSIAPNPADAGATVIISLGVS